MRREGGQVAIEWLGIVLVAAILTASIATSDIGGAVAGGVRTQICKLAGGACGESGQRDRGSRATAAGGKRRFGGLAPRAANGGGGNEGGRRRDRDGDGLSDAEERRVGSNPGRSDTDGDGVSDVDEVKRYKTDPIFSDTDEDGIDDAREVRSGDSLNPRKRDTDGDGLTDSEELAAGLKPNDEDSDGALGDTGDGLTDADELRRGTDPTKFDTDDDGDPDGYEVRNGTDPLKDERNVAQKFFDDVLSNPFDYLIPTGAVRSGASKAVSAAIKKVAPKLKDPGRVKKLGEALRLRRDRAAVARRIVQNKKTGDAARDRIAARNPGAHTEVALDTSDGARRIDVLTQDGRAIESKSGRTSLTKDVRRQIQKDVELRRNGAGGRVRSLEWHFSTSPKTGKVGPSKPLKKELRRNNIRIVYDP